MERERDILCHWPSFLRPLLPVEGGLRSYDLFALTVVIMIMGHVGSYFLPDANWLRVPDRIVVPVFLVSVGYNSGRQFHWLIWVSAIFMTLFNSIVGKWIHFDILAVIILTRLIVDPVSTWAIKSRARFIGCNLALFLLYPLTNHYSDYGSLGLILAMAGWVNRNRSEVSPDVVKPYEMFSFSYAAFLIYTDCMFGFSVPQIFIFAIGLAWIMYLLYNFRQLLLNAIIARPQDAIEKICSFIGHKSFEIYVIHALALQLLLMHAYGKF